MIANATKKHLLGGLEVGCVSKGDPYRGFDAASFIVYYMHKYRMDDIRPVSIDDVWEGGDFCWPHVPIESGPSSASIGWYERDPARQLIDELVGLGILIKIPDYLRRHFGEPEQDQFGHVLGVGHWVDVLRKQQDSEIQFFDFDKYQVPEFAFDPFWQPDTNVWLVDHTDKAKVSLNAFVSGDLFSVLRHGVGCCVATHRMFPRWERRHRMAVVHIDEEWPFEDGGWEDIEHYPDFTMREIHTLIENKTLIIRPDSVGKPIGPDDLVHMGHKDSIGLFP